MWDDYKEFVLRGCGGDGKAVVFCPELPKVEDSFTKVANYLIVPVLKDSAKREDYRECGSYLGFTTNKDADLKRPLSDKYVGEAEELNQKKRYITMILYVLDSVSPEKRREIGLKTEKLTLAWLRSKGVKMFTIGHKEGCTCSVCVSIFYFFFYCFLVVEILMSGRETVNRRQRMAFRNNPCEKETFLEILLI